MEMLRRGVLAGVMLLAGEAQAEAQGIVTKFLEEMRRETAGKLQQAVVRHQEKVNGWNMADTDNFQLYHFFSREEAQKVGIRLEQCRADAHLKWLGVMKGNWEKQCMVFAYKNANHFHVETGKPEQNPAFMRLYMEMGRVVKREIHINGAAADLLNTDLIHETTHAALAGELGPILIPPWANEGMAVVSESTKRHQEFRKCMETLRKEVPFLSARDMLHAKKPPPGKQGTLFYAQSMTLVRFFLTRGDERKFTAFLRDVAREGYDISLKKYYGYESLEALDEAYRNYLFPPPVLPPVIRVAQGRGSQ